MSSTKGKLGWLALATEGAGYRPAMPFLLVIAVAAIGASLQRWPVSARSAIPARVDLIAVTVLLMIMGRFPSIEFIEGTALVTMQVREKDPSWH